MPRRSEPTERQCLVSREVRPTAELVRFVLGPEDAVVPDLKRVLPGRGVWVTGTRQAVAEAERKRLFARGFKQSVTVEPGLADRVDALMEVAALSALSLARKAGSLVTGFTKVETAIGSGGAAMLVEASDAAEDGTRKLTAAIVRRFGTPDGLPVVRLFSSDQMGLALGLTNVIHAAVLAGPAGNGFLACASALVRYRGPSITDIA
jgi:predicted RNA-binding protein YlxR (DUF448 family)